MVPQRALEAARIPGFERRNDFRVLGLLHVEATAAVAFHNVHARNLNIRFQALMNFPQTPVPGRPDNGGMQLRVQSLMPPKAFFIDGFLSQPGQQFMQPLQFLLRDMSDRRFRG